MSELEDSEFEYANLAESESDDSDIESDSKESEDDDQTTDIWQQINTNVLNPAPLRFQFLGVPGCTFNADNFEVLDYFQLCFDNDLVNLLIIESNRYTEQQPRRSSDVLSITTDEMQIFLCINIIQGIIRKSGERMYTG